MCQILNIDPGVDIPFDKLELSCDINKHGYGLSWVENGEIKIVRSLKQPNDPKEVAELLDKHKKFRRFLHLRHVTVGAVNYDNSHPFVLLTKGRQVLPTICMMHNGTLNNWLPEKNDFVNSDTLIFSQYLAAPLAARCQAFGEAKNVLKDALFRRVITAEAGTSVLLLFDVFGNYLTIDRWNKGKSFKGFWASNDYSFDKNHHRSSQRIVSAATYREDEWDWETNTWKKKTAQPVMPWEETALPGQHSAYMDWQQVFGQDNQDPPPRNSIGPRSPIGTTLSTKTQCLVYAPDFKAQIGYKRIRERIALNKETNVSKLSGPVIRNLRVNRPTFCELAKMSDLNDIENLTEADLKEFCEKYPAAMAQLVIEQQHAVRRAEVKAKALGIKLAGFEKAK